MNINSKAFTLTELIVTIAIIGILLGISFPAITSLYNQNKEKEYIAYQDAVLKASKLYIESHRGVSTITLDNLKSAKLIGQYSKKGVTCTGSVSVKYTNKAKTKYDLEPNLIFEENGKTVYRSIPLHY